jgi:NAD(P)H-hydrate repair Nnr-like enzyme with NAD(P)H-hydrate dehydratase domain
MRFNSFYFYTTGGGLSKGHQTFRKWRNPMTKKLSGKVALVTGGSRGIGAASARALADEGADVAISYVASPEKAEAVVTELKARGVKT